MFQSLCGVSEANLYPAAAFEVELNWIVSPYFDFWFYE
jgi:hypothetical protein